MARTSLLWRRLSGATYVAQIVWSMHRPEDGAAKVMSTSGRCCVSTQEKRVLGRPWRKDGNKEEGRRGGGEGGVRKRISLEGDH